MGSYAYAAAQGQLAETSLAEVDRAVARVRAKRRAWTDTNVAARVALLEEIGDRLLAEADRWAETDSSAKGFGEIGRNEAWQNIYAGMQNVMRLRDTLAHLRDHGVPPEPQRGYTHRGSGQVVARVFPTSIWDQVALPLFKAEVWIDPSLDLAATKRGQAALYRGPKPHPDGRVTLVLAAGNQATITFMDLLSVLFADDSVVVMKMNPVNDYLGPIFADILRTFVDRGWLEVVYGGPTVGAHLASHEGIDRIHMTGSDATHDAIVWGPAAGRAERKARGERVVTKEITSELGNVTPIMVVPGPWSEKDLDFQANTLAINVAHNASFNCLALKVLVVPDGWEHTDRLLGKIRNLLAKWGPRRGYYPGARERWSAYVAAHPKAETFGPTDDPDIVPWTMVTDVTPDSKDEICFTKESFCGVFSVVRIQGNTPHEFLPKAVRFCNDRLWGTLVCGILIHPRSQRDPAGNAAFEAALDELRYGSIVVNQFTQAGFGVSVLPWGAFPGHPPEDIGSGTGSVHNAMLYPKPQKGVVYAPFRLPIKMPWLPEHTKGAAVWRRLTELERHPSPLRLPGIAWSLMTG